MAVPEPLPAARLVPGDLLGSLDSTDLVYFLLNIGDGDCQLVLLPAGVDGRRRAIVVDVASRRKIAALIKELEAAQLLPTDPGEPRLPIVVGTHPHGDHIGGMAAFIRDHRADIGEYWEPGYYFPSKSFLNTRRELEAVPATSDTTAKRGITTVLPAAGTVRYLDQVAVTVLSPSVGLRNRFDTYGVGINDASITLMIEYPAAHVVVSYDEAPEDLSRERVRQRLPGRSSSRLLLGADTQTAGWANVTVDFPALQPQESWIARELRRSRGADHLAADVFKISHHGSKHGVNLELVERVSPRLSLVSSVPGGGSYNFPHTVAQEMVREGLQATAGSSSAQRKTDSELGLFYTGDADDAGVVQGSIAVVIKARRGDLAVWRFGDAPDDDIRLATFDPTISPIGARRWA